MLSKRGDCTRRSNLKISRKSVVFTNKVGRNSRYFVGVVNKTVISQAHVGYEMIIATSYIQRALVG